MSFTRRAFLAQSSAAAAVLATPALALSAPLVKLTCQHTGRQCAFPFDGTLTKAAVASFQSVTRDWRRDEIAQMDLRLITILAGISRKAGMELDHGILSGYRSPETNRSLNGTSDTSLHMLGRALDLRHDTLSTPELARIARGLKMGGVGYYPSSGFVHVDTGGLRTW